MVQKRIREELLKKAVIAIELGLEQPIKVLGSRPGRKDPKDFAAALAKLNELGLIVFGTAMVGLPWELWSKEERDNDLPIVPLATMTEEEWTAMLNCWLDWFENLEWAGKRVPMPGAVLFGFTLIPATSAFEILQRQGRLRFQNDELIQRKERLDDFFVSLNPDLIEGLEIRRATEDLRRSLWSTRSIIKRMRGANLSPKRFMFMLLFNLFAGVAIRDRMI